MPVGLKVLSVQFGMIKLDPAGAATQRVHLSTVLKQFRVTYVTYVMSQLLTRRLTENEKLH